MTTKLLYNANPNPGKNPHILVLVVLLSLAYFACTSPSQRAETPPDSINYTAKSPNTAVADSNNNTFITAAAINGMMKLESSTLILKATENPDVQTLATILVKEQLLANRRLNDLAKQQKVRVPHVLPAEQREQLKTMENLKEEARNLYYAQLIQEVCKEAAAIYYDGKEDSNTAFTQYASQQSATIDAHLKAANNLAHILKVIRKDKGDLPIKLSKPENR